MLHIKTISPTPLRVKRFCLQPCLQTGAVVLKPAPVVLVKDKLKIEFELKLSITGINVNVTTNVNAWQHVAPVMRIGAVFDEDLGLTPMCSPAHRQFQSLQNQRYYDSVYIQPEVIPHGRR